MEVASVFDSKRGEVSELIKETTTCVVVDNVVVIVQRYQPLRQGVIDAATLLDLLPS